MLMSQMICCSKTIMMQKQILTLFHLYPSVVVCLLLTHLPAANYRFGQKGGGAFNEERMTLFQLHPNEVMILLLTHLPASCSSQ